MIKYTQVLHLGKCADDSEIQSYKRLNGESQNIIWRNIKSERIDPSCMF